MFGVRWGETIERSVAGQVALAVLMVVIVVSLLLWNMPAGRPRTSVGHAVNPVVQAVGLEQSWALFAPAPPQYGIAVYATVTYPDGHTKKLTPPHNGLLLSPYRTYRWQKYVEKLTADADSFMWEPAARWFAQQAGGHVVKVVLTRIFRRVVTPGDSTSRPPRQHYDFYTLSLR
ncbi:MAG: hypothetical protein M3Y91_10450 [Actinomycetota bacterium]|nr:hypothetical protein [Actinomycetota bacterium]